tara:strand:- start:476 stop:1027 length:552 start_codon:yes stop_codon:yes gene_type:complete
MKIIVFLITAGILLSSCEAVKYKKVSAKDYPPEPEKRVKKNIEEGKGFRLFENGFGKGGGTFDFASANPLWRASLDTIDFMPLLSANYSGGIIITDWYNDGESKNQSIKITIRFLSNEIRVDALDIKIFTKNCSSNLNCKVSENEGTLLAQLKKSILKKAAIYEKELKDKNFKPYKTNPTTLK